MRHRYSKSFALRGDIARGTPGSKPGVEVARLDVGELHCDMVIKVHRAVTMSRTSENMKNTRVRQEAGDLRTSRICCWTMAERPTVSENHRRRLLTRARLR